MKITTGIIVWEGRGWYAPRSERDDIWYYRIAPEAWEDDVIIAGQVAYASGLGTPDWFDFVPCTMEEK